MTRNKCQETPASNRRDDMSIVRRLDELRQKGVVSFPANDAKREFKPLAKRPGALRCFLASR
ncbi:MAG: hypothetical protein QOE82_1894 [Thermoanaerobaculia bacterium]|nr:hypothetical protein [Thermoanaerobaculia bacterium]